MKTEIVKFPRAAKPAPVAKTTPKQRRALRNQLVSATALGGVAMVLTGLSLDHLATGVGLVTGSTGWQPWAMAIGVDLAYVGLEMATLTATKSAWDKIATLTKRALVATMAGSALLNALAFAHRAPDAMAFQCGAAVLGLAIPVAIYVLTRIGGTMYLDATSR